ncbi:helix-turn-helix transcriptional regulator [Ornithinibacillus sp. FSL M8-0202]|uniref:helix-turn-helix transcriptional regulator n=1 Tax=Ornithinibacillus sp. FSL M8-0202 TaxID=2921616 RepID=UPI0030D2DA2C
MDLSTVGERIKQLRKERKLTLAQLAQDKMSAAMVSLIENGKSNPSAENLKHIANVLNVNISDLLGGMSRESLQKKATSIAKRIEVKLDLSTLQITLQEIQELIPDLGHNVESAKIYECYVRCLYALYVFYPKEFKLYEDKNWNRYLQKAESIYADLKMESKVLGIRHRLAEMESVNGNYHRTIEIVDDSLYIVKSMDSLDTISNMVRLMLLKVYCLEALGHTDETFTLLHEVIEFSNQYMMLNHFFEIHNLGAMLYYQENEFEKAREFVGKINKFFEIIHHEELYIEKEFIMIHYMEFFEDEPKLSLDMIQNLEGKLSNLTLYNEVVDQRLQNMLSDLKARCYTKLKETEKALPLFRELLNDTHAGVHPMDVALREVNKSYQALCYMELGDKEKAEKTAKESVAILKKYPRTTYYHFARNVLKEVQQMK